MHRLGTSSPRCLSLLPSPPSFLLSLYFLARPFSTRPSLLPLSCYSLFLPTLSNCRSDVSSLLLPLLSLSLLSNGEARKGSGKKVLLVFPSASPIECDVVNEGEGVWGGRREEEHGYSLLSLPSASPVNPSLPSFRFAATTCLFFSKPVSSLFFLLLPDTSPLTLLCLVVALLAAGHFIVVALDATT